MLLEMKGITKAYGAVLANDQVDIAVRRGQVLAIVGENGAGKSTLMKILYGLEQPDAGEIVWGGCPVRFQTPRDAMRRGIGMVQQHFMLFPTMTVAENIVFGNERRRGILFDRGGNAAQVRALSERYGLQVDPDAVVGECPVGTQQRVEILRTLYQNADILILDEPSAVLTPLEVDELLETIRRLAALGKAVILITHKLHEVMRVSDDVVVMRDGRVVLRTHKEDTSVEELSLHAVGRCVRVPEIAPVATAGRLLQVGGLTLLNAEGRRVLDAVALHVDGGEIVGIAGLAGNGQLELAHCVSGLRQDASGSIRLKGTELNGRQVAAFRRGGVAYIPEDRYAWGSAAKASLADNLLMGSQRKPGMGRRGILRPQRVNRYAAALLREHGIKAASVFQRMQDLSGGHAQRLVVARELAHHADLLVACEPTRGVDVGAMELIHGRLLEKRAKGDGVLLVSSELSEIIKLSDRIYVVYEGRVAGEFRRGCVTEQELGLLMTGGKTHATNR